MYIKYCNNMYLTLNLPKCPIKQISINNSIYIIQT